MSQPQSLRCAPPSSDMGYRDVGNMDGRRNTGPPNLHARLGVLGVGQRLSLDCAELGLRVAAWCVSDQLVSPHVDGPDKDVVGEHAHVDEVEADAA